MVKVEPVDVIGIEVPNVPRVHVLHLLSPHGEKPTDVCVVVFECILVWCMVFPLPLEKVRPHSSHTSLFLSMVVTVVLDGG